MDAGSNQIIPSALSQYIMDMAVPGDTQNDGPMDGSCRPGASGVLRQSDTSQGQLQLEPGLELGHC